jgi:hypothetical protein
MLRTRLARFAAACAVAAAVLVPLGTLGAEPAFASDVAPTGCVDYVLDNSTVVYSGPYEESNLVEYLNEGDAVNGACYYYNNTRESRWYMGVQIPGYPYEAYIWVQDLSYGSSHLCQVKKNGYFKIPTATQCDLIAGTWSRN